MSVHRHQKMSLFCHDAERHSTRIVTPRALGSSRPVSAFPADPWGRPLLEGPLRGLLAAMVEANRTALGHVDVERICLVAGPARRAARASIRPLTFGGAPPRLQLGADKKPSVHQGGRLMLYELCLRPLFFREASPGERLAILAHELWHLSPRFDGTLAPERRHPLPDPAAADRFAVSAAEATSGSDLSVLEHVGELRAPMWLDRPPSLVPGGQSGRLAYDERDLFLGVVEQL